MSRRGGGAPRQQGLLCPVHSGEWRNWQTRRIQVPVSERMWGFKSPLAHHGAPDIITQLRRTKLGGKPSELRKLGTETAPCGVEQGPRGNLERICSPAGELNPVCPVQGRDDSPAVRYMGGSGVASRDQRRVRFSDRPVP